MGKATRGRRPVGSGTREAILQSARRQFGEFGYRRTTLRGVAKAAGVDPRLVLHYFGSKQQLFVESVELPIDPEVLFASVFEPGDASVGERMAEAMVSLLEEPSTRQVMIGLIRAAASEPEVADLIRQVLTERLLRPLADRVGGDDAQLRASLIASQFVGLAMARYIVKVEPLASASGDQVRHALAPVVDHYLTEEWDEDRSKAGR